MNSKWKENIIFLFINKAHQRIGFKKKNLVIGKMGIFFLNREWVIKFCIKGLKCIPHCLENEP